MKDTRSNYQKFMSFFPGLNTFQIFPDKEADLKPRVIHNADPKELMELNGKGYGIFLAVNQTDGKGRSANNITRVRAVFADLDGVSPAAMMDDMPHMVVESSKGKFHGYFFVDESFPLAGFKSVQKAISYKYASDPAVNDLPRVMRVPGFYHAKKDRQPVTVVFINDDQRKLTYADCCEKFPPEPVKKWTAKQYTPGSEEIDVGCSTGDLLDRFGWVNCYGQRWTRPGKEYGVSGEMLESGMFFVYTSSTPLQQNMACDAFEILAQYDFGGNKSACMKHIKGIK